MMPLAPMQHTIQSMLESLALADDHGDEAPGTSPSHLSALLREASVRGDLPLDKLYRWVGFAQGVMWARGFPWHADFPAGGATEGNDDPIARATKAVAEGLGHLLTTQGDGLEDAFRRHLGSLLDEIQGKELSIEGMSGRLGFVQGAMAVHGLITVDGERDRTRPYFHSAYMQARGSVPPSVAVAAVSGERQ